MQEIFEFCMLICFGLSWPISVYKSLKSRSTQGKSVIFIVAIIVGYICGITSKVLSGETTYVLILYCINLFIVVIDLVLYFVNRHNENKEMRSAS